MQVTPRLRKIVTCLRSHNWRLRQTLQTRWLRLRCPAHSASPASYLNSQNIPINFPCPFIHIISFIFSNDAITGFYYLQILTMSNFLRRTPCLVYRVYPKLAICFFTFLCLFYFLTSLLDVKYWSIVALQCCVSFFCITKWISYMYTYIPIYPPSWVSLPPFLSHPSRW